MPESCRPRSRAMVSVDVEHQLKLLVGCASAAQAMFDRDLRCVAASPRWLAEFTSAPGPAQGQPIEALCPALPARWKACFLRGLDGETVTRERDLMGEHGTDGRWVSWSVCPWRDPGGRIGGVVISIADVPSRRGSSIGDRSPRHRLEDMLFENPCCGIAILDEEGRIASSNAVFRRLVDAGPEGTAGMCTGSFVHADDGDCVDRAIASASAGDVPGSPDVVRYVGSAGGERTVRQWMFPLRGGALQPGRVLLVAMDLAEVMEMKRRVRDAERIASAGIASAALAHDLASALVPLRAFVMALEASALAGDPGSRERGHLDGIRQASAYLQGLADDVARSELDGTGEPGTTDLAAWWRRTGDLLGRMLPETVDVRFECAVDAPCVAVPPLRVSQLCLNLLANAGRAVSDRPELRAARACIVIHASSVEADDGPWVRLSVTDDGIGMGGRERRHAIAALDGNGHGGAGLGLTIVHRIVDAAGGRVTIRSTTGEGTCVEVLLPAAAG